MTESRIQKDLPVGYSHFKEYMEIVQVLGKHTSHITDKKQAFTSTHRANLLLKTNQLSTAVLNCKTIRHNHNLATETKHLKCVREV